MKGMVTAANITMVTYTAEKRAIVVRAEPGYSTKLAQWPINLHVRNAPGDCLYIPTETLH